MSEEKREENQRDIGSSKGTFEIAIKFTQNSTWQGQIHWVEKNKKQNFRSALEMLKLMDEALKESEENTQVITW